MLGPSRYAIQGKNRSFIAAHDRYIMNFMVCHWVIWSHRWCLTHHPLIHCHGNSKMLTLRKKNNDYSTITEFDRINTNFYFFSNGILEWVSTARFVHSLTSQAWTAATLHEPERAHTYFWPTPYKEKLIKHRVVFSLPETKEKQVEVQ